MNFRSLAQLCIIFSTFLGCYEASDTIESDDDVGRGGGDQEIVEEKPAPPPSTPTEQEKTDEGFDPCPSDTYMLWEENGITYTIKIQVFCDPIRNLINLGCPAPF